MFYNIGPRRRKKFYGIEIGRLIDDKKFDGVTNNPAVSDEDICWNIIDIKCLCHEPFFLLNRLHDRHILSSQWERKKALFLWYKTNNGQLSSYVTDGVTNTLTYDEEIYIALVHGVTYDMTDAYLIPSVTKKKLLFHWRLAISHHWWRVRHASFGQRK